MAFGRPRHYDTQEALETAVEGYFDHIKGLKQTITDEAGNLNEVWTRPPEPATITGLALYLGFESRQSLYDYEKSGDFSYIVKYARLRVECEYEKRLMGDKPTGPIFALKNMGWSDKMDQDINHSGGINIIFEATPNCQPIADDYQQDKVHTGL